VLAGIPTVAAAGLAVGPVANIAIAEAHTPEVDPVFAAIDAYKAAVQARSIVLDDEDNEEAYPNERAWARADRQAHDDEWGTHAAILDSEPTTIAGIAAVLEILGTNLYAGSDIRLGVRHAGDEPGDTTLGLAYGSVGGYRAAAANALMLRLAATMRSILGRAA
jgi:hypothetical protein